MVIALAPVLGLFLKHSSSGMWSKPVWGGTVFTSGSCPYFCGDVVFD